MSWSRSLLRKLKDEDDDQVVEILMGLIEFDPEKRWSAGRCLERGFETSLFSRRTADSLIVGTKDPDEPALQPERGDDGTITPTARSPPTTRSLPTAESLQA